VHVYCSETWQARTHGGTQGSNTCMPGTCATVTCGPREDSDLRLVA
jgi:hypothetical protein